MFRPPASNFASDGTLLQFYLVSEKLKVLVFMQLISWINKKLIKIRSMEVWIANSFFFLLIVQPYTEASLWWDEVPTEGAELHLQVQAVTDTSLIDNRCLVKHRHLEGGLKAKQALPARPAEDTARTKASEVKCNCIKTLYIIMASQREMGQPAFTSSLQTQAFLRNWAEETTRPRSVPKVD